MCFDKHDNGQHAGNKGASVSTSLWHPMCYMLGGIPHRLQMPAL